MELLYAIIGFIIYVWLLYPKERTIEELRSKPKDDQNEYKKPVETTKKTKVSRPEATDYISILLSDKPIDDMTAYYIRQANDKNLYFTYISESPNWRLKRKTRFNIDNGICQSCGKTIYLNSFHCHHENYSSLFNEDMDDLISLCWLCHQEKHNH